MKHRNKEQISELPFATNYNDHFETPFQAYYDVKPVIDWLCSSQLNSNKAEIRLYDPYYCKGRTATLLKQLGYDKILHEKRDFYADISNDTVPEHDVLITNPPYSDSHKTQCLNFCFQKLREPDRLSDVRSKAIPFLLLMPAYVAAKQYFRQFLSTKLDSVNDVVYLIPSTTYKYDHPENTGKDFCPFESLWFFGIGRDQIDSFQKYWESLPTGTTGLKMVTTLAQLQKFNVISAQNRPNPKQRVRMRKRMYEESLKCDNQSSTADIGQEKNQTEKAEKKRKRRF